MSTKQLLGVSVDTYLNNDTQDEVTMNATTPFLPDGTICAQKILLDGSSQNVAVSLENAGYQHLSQE